MVDVYKRQLQYQGEDSSGMENPNNWHAVSGEPIAGWKVTEDTGMDGILTAAKENQHPFIVTPDGAYTCLLYTSWFHDWVYRHNDGDRGAGGEETGIYLSLIHI